MVNLIDTHCHIYSEKFESDRGDVIQNAILQGVNKILMPNVDEDSINSMLQLADEYPQLCYPMMGLHPCSVQEGFDEILDRMFLLFDNYHFIAVGEVGIDLYWDKTTLKIQQDALVRQVKFAIERNLPLALHTRSAMHEVVEILEQYKSENLRGVFHCFSESYELTNRILELGFYFGIGGVVTYKNSGLDEALKNIPLEKIILETDAPYLAPIPFRGKRNEPGYVWHVAKKVADVLQLGISEVGTFTAQNANDLFFNKT